MKIQIKLLADYNEYSNEIEKIISWDLQVLPRVNECVILDSLIKFPKEIKNQMWRVWAVDYVPIRGIGMCPRIWVEHCEAQ